MLNCQKRACLRSGMAREETMRCRYTALKKKQQKRKQKRNINEKENNKVKKTTNLWE